MTWFRAGGGGIPASLKNGMNAVLNKKFGTSGQTYAPSDWPDDVNLLGKLPEKTVSGAIANFSDGADEVPLKSLVANLPASLTPYEEVEITHTGKNLAGFDDRTYTVGGVTFTCNNQVVTVSNTSTTQYPQAIIAQNLLFKKGTYTASITVENEPSGGHLYIILQKGGSNYVSTKNGSSTFTLTEDSQLNFLAVAEGNGITWNDATLKFQIEAGSSASDYEAYQTPTVYTASLGRTIHGGTADVVSGQGSTKVHKQTYTGDNVGTVSITYGQADEGYTHLYFNIADIPLAYNPTSDNVISNITLPWNNNASAAGIPAVGECWRLINGGSPQKPIIYMYIHQTWASVADFKTWLNANPITVVYEVSDETAFTFGPVPIDSKLGNNTLWSEQGDIKVTYREDIDLALAQLSGTRGLMMASRSISPMIGEEASLDRENILEEVSENSDNEESEEER